MAVNANLGIVRIHTGTDAHLGTEAVGHGVFDAQRSKIQAFERTALRGDLYLERLLCAKPRFPRHLTSGGIQVILPGVRHNSQLHQHPLRHAAVQIELHDRAPAAPLNPNAAPLRLHGASWQGSNRAGFFCQQVLHTGCARQKQHHFVIHRASLANFWFWFVPSGGADASEALRVDGIAGRPLRAPLFAEYPAVTNACKMFTPSPCIAGRNHHLQTGRRHQPPVDRMRNPSLAFPFLVPRLCLGIFLSDPLRQ